MKKKGFTLIELLAVIVILAIIALIATPIVMSVIENAKKGAAERSAENYVDAVETVVATSRLDGTILEGEYTIQNDGNLCPVSGCGDEDKYKVNVDMSGNKPKEGTILIENGQVVDKLSTDTTTQTMIKTKDDYIVSYNTNGKMEATKQEEVETPPVSTLCTYVPEEGTTSKTVGAKYTCTLGDYVSRTFYVLGDNPNDSIKIDLIMDRNFTDNVVAETLKWCIDGKTDPTTCKSINSTDEGTPLKHIQDTFGSDVLVSFPTNGQIMTANNESDKDLPNWLCNNLSGNAWAYWTASVSDSTQGNTRYVMKSSLRSITPAYGDGIGVRPVITIPKTALN